MLRTADLDYHLPPELIATQPMSPRDAARLMVLRRSDPSFIQHRQVRDLPEILGACDTMIVNRTRVLPARLRGVRTDTGGRAEGLYIHERSAFTPGTTLLSWQVLLKLRRAKEGVTIRLETNRGEPSPITLRLVSRIGTESGEEAAGWAVVVEGAPDNATTPQILEQVGLTPLPPYILAARRKHEQPADDVRDRAEYQTVYAAAGASEAGSVAAPTAGLHFTPELLEVLRARGVARAEVELAVGMGTFKPVETEYVEQHTMHSEWCTVPRETAEVIQQSLANRGASDASRLIAIGTTTARTLESFATPAAMLATPSVLTRILITPGHRFRHFDSLLTNFHLPRSTLLAMVAAFLDDDDRVRGQGLARLLTAYRVAVDSGYRFYSFGDAMVILP